MRKGDEDGALGEADAELALETADEELRLGPDARSDELLDLADLARLRLQQSSEFKKSDTRETGRERTSLPDVLAMVVRALKTPTIVNGLGLNSVACVLRES